MSSFVRHAVLLSINTIIQIYSSRDGPITLRNPHIADLTEDVLYHLNLSDKANDLPAMFGDVKVTNTHTHTTGP